MKPMISRWLRQPRLAALAPLVCLVACEPHADRAPPDIQDTSTVNQSVAGASENSGHRITVSNCPQGVGCNLAENVPMTGLDNQLFREVDIAMRQFIRAACAGGGVLSFSRRGRRVYKRGFGRTAGWAGGTSYGSQHFTGGKSYDAVCPDDGYDASGRYFLPDSPLGMGSTTKWVIAAMVRELVEQRIEQRGYGGMFSDATEVPLLDSGMDLLPQYLQDYFAGNTCLDPGIAIEHTGCNANRLNTGSCALKPDARWHDITIGDLIRHSAALPETPNLWREVIPRMASLRLGGSTSKSDWTNELDHLVAKTEFPDALALAQGSIAANLGTKPDNIIFVDSFGSSEGEHPMDEILKLASGMCLKGAPGEATDSTPSQGPRNYSNFGYDILGRVVAHLHAELNGGLDLAGAETGYPQTQDGAALATFLGDNGLRYGVSHNLPVFKRQLQYGISYDDPLPETFRHYKNGAYIYYDYGQTRPFCRWDGLGSCDFTPWTDAVAYNSQADMRARKWDFSSGVMPFHRVRAGQAIGGGLMAGEAPALVRLANKYYAKDLSVFQGHLRSDLGDHGQAGADGGKNGQMDGATAWVYQGMGDSLDDTVPPRDINGRLRITEGRNGWSNITYNTAADVDFAVMINQDNSESFSNGDNGTTDDYNKVASYVRWGLTRVDWDAVDFMIHAQKDNTVGVAINSVGSMLVFREGDGNLGDHAERVDYFNGIPQSTGTGPAFSYPYLIPGSRNGSDVLDVAVKRMEVGEQVYTYYSDGHYSMGSSSNLGSTSGSYGYTYFVPDERKYDEMLGASFGDYLGSTIMFSWWQGASNSYGHYYGGLEWDLGSVGASLFTVPEPQAVDQIVGVAIDQHGTGHVWTRYRDGSISEGSHSNLAYYNYWHAIPVDMSISNGHTTFYYDTGWQRTFAGSPTDALVGHSQVSSGPWYAGGEWGAYREPSEVKGVGKHTYGHLFYADGTGVQISPAGAWTEVSVDYGGLGESAGKLLASATSTANQVFTWYSTGYRGAGGVASPFAADRRSYTGISVGVSTRLKAAAIDDSAVWTIWKSLYGSDWYIAKGTSRELAAHGTFTYDASGIQQ